MSDGNGLEATAYRQLSRLPAGRQSVVLAELAAAGVAAYVETGWLHVDESRWEQARRICDRVLDRIAFDEIVANFATDGIDPSAASAATASAAPPSTPPPTPAAPPVTGPTAQGDADAAHAAWLRGEAADPPPPRYIPPEPPRQPLAWVTRLAWFAVFAGPLCLGLMAVLGTAPDPGLVWAAVLAFGGGIIALLLQHSSKPPDDDEPPDDGAVV